MKQTPSKWPIRLNKISLLLILAGVLAGILGILGGGLEILEFPAFLARW